MSASLSYTTVFSMAPLLIVILYLFEHFFNREALEGIIFSQAKEFIGNNAALQLQTMIQQLSISKEGNFGRDNQLYNFNNWGNFCFCRNTRFYKYYLGNSSKNKIKFFIIFKIKTFIFRCYW